MKNRLFGLLAPVMFLAASSAHADLSDVEYFKSVRDPKIKMALVNTQFLAAAICHDKANMDPKVLVKQSNTVPYLASLKTQDGSLADPETQGADVRKHLEGAHCDKNGILQLRAVPK